MNNETLSFQITCKVSDIFFDLIIGRPVIGSQDLTVHLPSQFRAAPMIVELEGTVHPCNTLTADPTIIAATVTKEHILGLAEEDDDGILEDDDDSTDIWLVKVHVGLSPIPTALYGSSGFTERLTSLCMEYKEISSRNLKEEPAYLPPFTVDADIKRWETKQNQTACRPQSPHQNQEIKMQIEKSLRCKAIRYSQAAYYSHVLLVKKPEKGFIILSTDDVCRYAYRIDLSNL